MWKGSGFVADFDEASMIGTVFSSAKIARREPCFPGIEKVVFKFINILNCSFVFGGNASF
jgi:hypothetical protein